MSAKIFGVVGYKGSGKTTICRKAICKDDARALPILQMNIVEPISEVLLILGVPADIVRNKSRWNEPLEMLCGHSTRYAAQTLGTEWGRDHIGNDFWLNIGLERARQTMREGVSVLMDNVRFPNEFHRLREMGAIMIALYRPGLIVDDRHESEQHIAILQRQCDVNFTNPDGMQDRTAAAVRAFLADAIEG